MKDFNGFVMLFQKKSDFIHLYSHNLKNLQINGRTYTQTIDTFLKIIRLKRVECNYITHR